MRATVYTDGACSGNPGPGGWAAVIKFDDNTQCILKGNEEQTTNNRMELMAVIEAFRFAIKNKLAHITILSDSSYVVNAINDGWMVKWRLNNWQSSRNEEVKNKDMWQVLYKLVYSGKIPYKIKKVKGHNGISLNELADLKAREQIKSL